MKREGRSTNICKLLLLVFQAWCCLAGHAAFAHPHAFVSCTFSFVMDSQGLAGFRQRWVLDEMTTVSVLDVVDQNRDGILSPEEKQSLRDLSVNSLREFGYFTTVRINGRPFPVRTITDFSAELKDHRLIYDFRVPCPVTAVPGLHQQVKVAVYDDSFYTYVAYATERGTDIDPSRDPMFANREAPARPGDFERFARAVGIEKFSGKIPISGDTDHFKLASRVEEAQDMAYFYGQIVPQTFVLEFEPR